MGASNSSPQDDPNFGTGMGYQTQVGDGMDTIDHRKKAVALKVGHTGESKVRTAMGFTGDGPKKEARYGMGHTGESKVRTAMGFTGDGPKKEARYGMGHTGESKVRTAMGFTRDGPEKEARYGMGHTGESKVRTAMGFAGDGPEKMIDDGLHTYGGPATKIGGGLDTTMGPVRAVTDKVDYTGGSGKGKYRKDNDKEEMMQVFGKLNINKYQELNNFSIILAEHCPGDANFPGRVAKFDRDVLSISAEELEKSIGDDTLSFVFVNEGVVADLFENPEFKGRRITVEGPEFIECLAKTKDPRWGGFNDTVSSIQLTYLDSNKLPYAEETPPQMPSDAMMRVSHQPVRDLFRD